MKKTNQKHELFLEVSVLNLFWKLKKDFISKTRKICYQVDLKNTRKPGCKECFLKVLLFLRDVRVLSELFGKKKKKEASAVPSASVVADEQTDRESCSGRRAGGCCCFHSNDPRSALYLYQFESGRRFDRIVAKLSRGSRLIWPPQNHAGSRLISQVFCLHSRRCNLPLLRSFSQVLVTRAGPLITIILC